MTGDPDLIYIMDAAKEGPGGMVVGKIEVCLPIVFCLEWPPKV